MSNLEKLLAQQKSLAERIAVAKANEKKLAREKVVRAAEKAGLFALSFEVLEREFSAIGERNRS